MLFCLTRLRSGCLCVEWDIRRICWWVRYQAGWFRVRQRNVPAAEPQRNVPEQLRQPENNRDGDGRPDANDDEQVCKTASTASVIRLL